MASKNYHDHSLDPSYSKKTAPDSLFKPLGEISSKLDVLIEQTKPEEENADV